MPSSDRFSRRQFVAMLGTGVGCALAGCLGESKRSFKKDNPITDWPTVGHDRANTRYSPAGTAPTASPTTVWRRPIEIPLRQPVVADRRVYMPDRNTLRVYQAATGEELWTYSPHTPTAQSLTSPTVADGVVYLGHSAGRTSLSALDSRTGDVLWELSREELGAVPGTPTLGEDGEALYVGTMREQVHRIDPASGDIRWSRDVFGPVATTLAVRSPLVVATTLTGEVYAFDESGDAFWRTQLAESIECPPSISDWLVIVGCTDSHVYGLDPVTGRIMWSPFIEQLYHGGFVTTNSSVYAVGGRSIVAVGQRHGRTNWSIQWEDFITCAPMLVDESLYVGGPTVTALKSGGGFGIGGIRLGATRWSADLGGHIGPGMAASDGRLFVPVRLSDTKSALIALESRD